MRSLILILITVLTAPFYSVAQFSKGDIAIGGSLSLYTQKTPASADDGYEERSTSLSLQPSIRYFINEKIAIGAGIGYQTGESYTLVPDVFENKYRYSGYSIDLTIRRYSSITENFLFSIGAQASYGGGTSSNSSVTEESKSDGYSINASPRLHFFPTKNWCIEGGIGSIGVGHSRQRDSDRNSTSFHANIGMLAFGIAYYFRD